MMIILYIASKLLVSLFESSELEVDKVEFEEPVTIRFYSSWGGEDNKSEIVDQLIQDFNKANPDVIVVNESMSGEDFLFNLKTDFASNHPPDVFGLWPGSDLKQLVELGKVADIKPALLQDQAWLQRFKPSVVEDYFEEDAVYSVPFEMIYEGLFINTSLFEVYNIEVPSDITSLESACKALKARQIVPIAYNATPEGSFLYQTMVASIGGKEIEDDPQLLKKTMIEAADEMKRLYEMGAFPKEAFLLDDYSRNQMFLEGNAAMIAQGSWYVDEEFGQNFNVSFIPFPYKENENRAIYGLGNGYFHVSSEAEKDGRKWDASIRFLKFLTSEESCNRFHTLAGFESSLKCSDEMEGTIKMQGAKAYVAPIDHLVNRSVWESDTVKRFPLFFTNKISSESLIDSLFEP